MVDLIIEINYKLRIEIFTSELWTNSNMVEKNVLGILILEKSNRNGLK